MAGTKEQLDAAASRLVERGRQHGDEEFTRRNSEAGPTPSADSGEVLAFALVPSDDVVQASLTAKAADICKQVDRVLGGHSRALAERTSPTRTHPLPTHGPQTSRCQRGTSKRNSTSDTGRHAREQGLGTGMWTSKGTPLCAGVHIGQAHARCPADHTKK